MRRGLAALILALALVAVRPAIAGAGFDPAEFAFRPHPGARLPLPATLVDEAGRSRTLGQYFSGKPVVLVLEYLRCKSLCGLTLENVMTALDALPLDAGRDYQFVAISIDPRDTPADAAKAKAKYLAFYHHPGAARGVHFLTGPKAAVASIADTVGFPYRYDPTLDQYIHPAGFVLAAPDGAISSYIYGVGPTAAALKKGLADAAAGKALSPLTRLLLFCHIEGVPLGRFTVPVLAAFTLADAAATAALIAVFVAIRRRRHR